MTNGAEDVFSVKTVRLRQVVFRLFVGRLFFIIRRVVSMCILIASIDGELPTLAELIECERANPHGIGIAWAEDGRLVVRKAMSLAEFLPMLFDKPDISPYVLHFRYATHGEVGLDNCHPFTVGGGMAMAHNGILPWRSTDKRSDSRCFAKDIIRPNRSMIFDESFQAHIEEFIGDYNKLAFITRDGDVSVYNESAGHWRCGIWFSNHGYRCGTKWTTDAEWEALMKEDAGEDEENELDYIPRELRGRPDDNEWTEGQSFRDWHRDGSV